MQAGRATGVGFAAAFAAFFVAFAAARSSRKSALFPRLRASAAQRQPGRINSVTAALSCRPVLPWHKRPPTLQNSRFRSIIARCTKTLRPWT